MRQPYVFARTYWREIFVCTVLCVTLLMRHKGSASWNVYTRPDGHSSMYSSKCNVGKIESMQKKFSVAYVEQTDMSVVKQGFLDIHVTTDTEHNAWLFVMRMNDGFATHILLVTCDPKEYPDIYPFYTLDKDLYTTLSYTYEWYAHPFQTWEGHVYAVNRDTQSGEISFCGAAKRDYPFRWCGWRPKCMRPVALTVDDWEEDMQFLEEESPPLKRRTKNKHGDCA